MKRRLGNVPVVVGTDRYEAGLFAESRDLGNVFILDDGFQHRRLYRGVDLVAIDPIERSAGETVLPRGRGREPRSVLRRADAACGQDLESAAVEAWPLPSC